MKKFVSLRVEHLKLDNLAGLCRESILAAEPIVPTVGLPLLQAALSRLVTDTFSLISLLDHSHKSPLTPEIQTFDKQCGEGFGEIKRGLTYYEKSSDPAKSAAAKLLLTVFKPVWNMMTEPLASQFTMLETLEERIFASFQLDEALNTLELMGTWIQLRDTAQTLRHLYQQRLSDNADNALPAASGMKATVVKDYDSLCTLTEQSLGVLPSAGLEKLFHELNELRVKYVHHLPKDLSAADHCVIEPIGTQPYTEKPVIPIPRAYWREKDKPTVELVFAKDFSVTYKNNVNVGTAEVTLHGKGAYKGQKTATFNIAR
jgi:hypothetical protein